MCVGRYPFGSGPAQIDADRYPAAGTRSGRVEKTAPLPLHDRMADHGSPRLAVVGPGRLGNALTAASVSYTHLTLPTTPYV